MIHQRKCPVSFRSIVRCLTLLHDSKKLAFENNAHVASCSLSNLARLNASMLVSVNGVLLFKGNYHYYNYLQHSLSMNLVDSTNDYFS